MKRMDLKWMKIEGDKWDNKRGYGEVTKLEERNE